MKKSWISALLILIASLGVLNAKAQVSFSANIGQQPAWGPVGYDHVEYYYMPDIDAYYYVPNRQYVYLNGPNWVFSRRLPARYKSYNIYQGYKVVINEPKPYLRHDVYKVKYKSYKGAYGKQALIKNGKIKSTGNGKAKSYGNGNGNKKGNGSGKGKSKGNGKGKH